MSIFDKLLEVDAAKLAAKENKQVEITRLSTHFGEPFIVTCATMSIDQFQHVVETSKEEDYKAGIVLEGCRIDGKKFSDAVWLNALGVQKGIDVVKKLFRAGEIQKLHNTVSLLSGYGDDAVAEVKN